MAKTKLGTIAVAAVVTAAIMQAETESPGATARGTAQVREAVVPAATQVLGAAGDAVLAARTELGRQGVNPGALLSTPTTAGLGGPPDTPQGIPPQSTVKP